MSAIAAPKKIEMNLDQGTIISTYHVPIDISLKFYCAAMKITYDPDCLKDKHIEVIDPRTNKIKDEYVITAIRTGLIEAEYTHFGFGLGYGAGGFYDSQAKNQRRNDMIKTTKELGLSVDVLAAVGHGYKNIRISAEKQVEAAVVRKYVYC